MLDTYSRSNQSPQARSVREAIQSSGATLESLSSQVQLTIQCLEKGDFLSSRQSFDKVLDELVEFMEILSRARQYAGEKATVIGLYHGMIKEYLQRLEQLQQNGEVGDFVDVLQYEIVPLLAGWDGVKNELVDCLNALQ